MLELRMEFEPAMAALAASRHDGDDRHRLLKVHTAFIKVCSDASLAQSEDYAFHYAVAAATGNPCFTAFYEQLRHRVIPRANLIDDEINPASTGAYLSRVEGSIPISSTQSWLETLKWRARRCISTSTGPGPCMPSFRTSDRKEEGSGCA
ncbi:FadR/GntR family transcriptional regulator [Modicisalibacter luteus]